MLETIGMEDRVDELKQAVEKLVDLRREGAGDYTEVMVNRTKERRSLSLKEYQKPAKALRYPTSDSR